MTARERITIEGGGYRRDHLRALAERVEVADKEVRIMGSKHDLLRTLTAASGVRGRAKACRERAEAANDPRVKAHFQEMAETWERLAKQAEVSPGDAGTNKRKDVS